MNLYTLCKNYQIQLIKKKSAVVYKSGLPVGGSSAHDFFIYGKMKPQPLWAPIVNYKPLDESIFHDNSNSSISTNNTTSRMEEID